MGSKSCPILRLMAMFNVRGDESFTCEGLELPKVASIFVVLDEC